jgi:uncharacterized protein YkwD
MIKKWLVGLICVMSMIGVSAVPAHAMSEEEVVESLNSARFQHGLVKFVLNKKLANAAELKLKDMQTDKYWSHNNPVTGLEWWRLLYNAGVRGKAAENLARGYSESAVVVEAWESSPTHKANMLSKMYRKVGVAIGEVEYPTGTKTVVIAEFGD